MACSKLAQDLDRQLECPICLERLRTPRILRCLHSFCEDCIGEHMEKKKRNDAFPCPVCNEEFKVPDDGARGLKRNTFLSQISDLLPQSSRSDEKCDVCKVKHVDCQAQSMCIQCRDRLCEQCARTHTSGSTLTVNHQVVTLENVKAGKYLNEIQRFQKITCPNHPDKVMEIYCETCEKPVCFLCFAVKHTQHRMKSVDEATQSAEEVVQELFEPWKEATDHCGMLSDDRKKILEDLVNNEENMIKEIKRIYSEFKTETNRQIEIQIDATINKLKKQVAAARKQLETWYEEAEFRKTTVASTLNYATRIFGSASDVEKLRQFDDIKKRLEGLDIESIETESKKPVFKLQPSKIAVPDLNVDVVTVMETKEVLSKLCEKMDEYLKILQRPLPPGAIKKKANCVQSFNTGDTGCFGLTATDNWFIITTYSNKKVKVFDKRSHSLVFEVKQDLHRLQQPCGVTYNKRTRDTFITDCGIKGVVSYDSQGKVVKVTPGLYKADGMIRCHNEQLIIIDCDGERVMITDLNCNIQQTITKSSLGLNQFNPWCVCVNKQCHIVVSDNINSRVYVIDTQPAVIKTFNTSFKPWGVCVDQWGHILVANFSNSRVVLLTDPQVQERVIITSNDVQYPIDLTITARGHVAVLEHHTGSVKIFQYVDMK